MSIKTYQYTLGDGRLCEIIDLKKIKTEVNILIQVFSGEGREKLLHVTQELCTLLPQAICIGTTTDGEINSSDISTLQTVIAITCFEATKIKSSHVIGGDCFKNGQTLAKKLIEDNTKLLIVFTDGTTSNGEEFLKGIESVNADVLVSGGMAGDNGNFIQTYISESHHLLNQGAVGVSLNSDILHVRSDYSFNWSPIGVSHRVDKVNENRVYELDGMTPVDFYTKYLGEEVADSLPATGIEFPLIIEKDGIQIARAVIAKHDDGSLSFAGNLQEGDSVKLGFGNAELIINNPTTALEQFNGVNVEAFFLYSCMARRRYMPGLIQIEVEPFSKLAPTVGFFTYGEFYHYNQHNVLLNQTLTAVALWESKVALHVTAPTPKTKLLKEHSEYATTIQALTHLIQQSTADLEAQAQKLAEEKKYSQELLANQKLFMRHAIHETMTPLSVMMSNIELYEMQYGKNSYLSNIEAGMKNVFAIYDDLSYLVKKDQLEYPKHTIELIDYLRNRIDFFNEVARQSQLTFHFRSSLEKLNIYFNETKLQRLIDNNLTNAIKYTLENESIIISLHQDKEQFCISIESKSIHIQQPHKVFEAYYREGHAKEGFGLGLNLVKQICDEEKIEVVLKSDEELTHFSYYFNLEA
ncbi:MAG: FIST N-terminal domain-containing protein [Campylobacterota bacterium]|nr:FIST N-terminal domain-containing protein [Campylobacterota bacterium]